MHRWKYASSYWNGCYGNWWLKIGKKEAFIDVWLYDFGEVCLVCLFVRLTHIPCMWYNFRKPATCCAEQFWRNHKISLKIVMFYLVSLILIICNFRSRYHRGNNKNVLERVYLKVLKDNKISKMSNFYNVSCFHRSHQ